MSLEIVPSKLQMALALAVVQSKPDDTTIRDYILRLRSHLRYQPPIITGGTHRHHFDNVGYWRDQYERSNAQCRKLESRIIHLEQEKEMMQSQAENGIGLVAAANSKRKETVTKQLPTRTSKRTKNALDKPLNTGGLARPRQDSFSEDFADLGGLGQAGSRLVQSLHSIHKLYKRQGTDSEPLCAHLVETARSIGFLIDAVTKPLPHAVPPTSTSSSRAPSSNMTNEKHEMEFSSVIRASARAFTSLLVGLNKVSTKDAENRFSNIIVYECVKMFRSIIDSVGELARSMASQVASSNGQHPHPTSKARAKITKESKEPNNSRALVQLVNALLSYLDRNDPLHREIFEGFFYVLLERIGKRLFFCTFGCERSPAIEGDILNTIIQEDSAIRSKNEAESQVARQEVPLLISILERAIALAPHHLNTRLATGYSKATKPANFSRAATTTSKLLKGTPLCARAKDRLQRTLINCMFGENGDHDEFLECLRMPARMGGLPSVAKVEEENAAEWFQGEVWRLVGWDLLGKGGEW
ncbi:hypothetical protein GQ43DRAFT_275964 [Delitschia confertaspora ATCC 74209]|uniref:Uncharacterized protein n=1 Tax=Delitschia confertaspora ATCC 74209 TaxID=1513339 RepID=A0A9P4MRP6_9PLEO|nr:hypothetical protein GQ43DRAFT_275964 [Delitschia confertaspora ATCC 74209]